MLGIYYLLLSMIIGYIVCPLVFPRLKCYTNKTYEGKYIGIPRGFLFFPSFFLVGILIMTWSTYILAYLARDTDSPLGLANTVVLRLYTIFCIIYYTIRYYRDKRDGKSKQVNVSENYKVDENYHKNEGYIKNRKNNKDGQNIECNEYPGNNKVKKGELIYLFFIILVSIFLMWYTFYIVDNTAHVGFTVYSDFSQHIGMIRSFSKSNNFPTQYTFYANGDIRYHFMFYFLVGNLEFLGLRLDFALNIPSALGLISTYLLLYVLAVKITGKRPVGYLTGLLFTFRSSPSFFKYLVQIPKDAGILETLSNNVDYIGFTPNEDWGLWNLNVYCNQRHFSFSLAMLLLVIILFMPRLYKMFGYIKGLSSANLEVIESNNRFNTKIEKFKLYIKTILFTRESWIVEDYRLAIFTGILAGSTAFWNGATLIGLLSILFLMAILSANRLEYLITALIASGLALLQSGFFVNGSPVSPKLQFGFIVENPNIFNVIEYIFDLLGILPIILIIIFAIKKGINRYIMIAFLGPAIITFTVSLTPDITVNHKYLMISIMLLGIYAADLLVYIYNKKSYFYKIVAIILLVILASTGIYDFTTLIRSNTRTVQLDLNHEATLWIEENADSQDIFLTAPYALNQVVLGGPSLYQGWPYFPWSAGYDTDSRGEQVKLMYEANSPDELDALINKNNIRYIIVDRENKMTEEYDINEENIKNTYECVFEMGAGKDKLSIYDTDR